MIPNKLSHAVALISERRVLKRHKLQSENKSEAGMRSGGMSTSSCRVLFRVKVHILGMTSLLLIFGFCH